MGSEPCVKEPVTGLLSTSQGLQPLPRRGALAPAGAQAGGGGGGGVDLTAHSFAREGRQDSSGYHRAPLLMCACAPRSEPLV